MRLEKRLFNIINVNSWGESEIANVKVRSEKLLRMFLS